MTTTLTVPTIETQTGARRIGPRALIQDIDVLCLVTEYDFDLSNEAFVDYCCRRGVYHKAGVRQRLAFTANHLATREEFNSLFGCSTTGIEYSEEEMDTHWKIMLGAKGALQDCWQLWLDSLNDSGNATTTVPSDVVAESVSTGRQIDRHEEVLRQLSNIKQSLTFTTFPAIPLDAFLTMLRDELKFDLPLRTAQDMISDGRLPIVPKLRAGDKPWVNLHRWREMTKEPEHYFKFVHENSRRRVAKDSTSKSRQRAAA